MRTILAVGQHKDLLTTRSAVLRLTHAEVTQANPVEALRLLGERQFDLLVFCHTVGESPLREVVDAARAQNPNTQALWVVMRTGEYDLADKVAVDAEVVAADPRALVTKVMEMLDT